MDSRLHKWKIVDVNGFIIIIFYLLKFCNRIIDTFRLSLNSVLQRNHNLIDGALRVLIIRFIEGTCNVYLKGCLMHLFL